MEKPVSFASMFKENTSKNTVHLSELRNDECVNGADVSILLASVDEGMEQVLENGPWLIRFLLWTRYVAIPFKNGSGNSLETIDIEYEWKPPRCDTCKIFYHTDEYCPKKPKTSIPTPVMDDGFVGVTRKGKGKHASKPWHIDSFRLTKPKPNYFYRPVSSKSDDINIISLKNSFDALKDQDDMFETDKSAWQNNNNIENTVNEIDREEVENYFVEDNGKPIDGLVDDARKNVEAPPKKTPRKTANLLAYFDVLSGFMDSIQANEQSSVSQNSGSCDVVDQNSGPYGIALTEEIVAYEQESNETQVVKKLDALCTPESFVNHSKFDTPGGTVYYISKFYADVLLVKRTLYNSVDDCVVAYMKYALEARFVVRGSCQKRLRSEAVKQKYLVCNRKGCKARIVFYLVTGTTKYKLNVFDTIHNHKLKREEFKHLSKTKRQLTYAEQVFIVKAASVNIGATRADGTNTCDSSWIVYSSRFLLYGFKSAAEIQEKELLQNNQFVDCLLTGEGITLLLGQIALLVVNYASTDVTVKRLDFMLLRLHLVLLILIYVVKINTHCGSKHKYRVTVAKDYYYCQANALASTYQAPAENSLLEKTGDMRTFMNWYCQKMGKTKITQADLEGQAYEVANPEGNQVRIDISRPLPLSGPPGHVTIQIQFFFNKDLDYLRYGSKGCGQALSISKMKATRNHEFGLELLVPKHMWIDDVCTYDISASYEKDFKNLYPSNFEDLNLLLLQGHLNHLPGSDKRKLSTAVNLWTHNLVIRQRVEDFPLGIASYQKQLNLTKLRWDATGFEYKHDYTITKMPYAVVFPVDNNERKIMRFNEIYKFSDGMLTNIMEALDYRVKEYKVNRLNPGMNTRFWTAKDVTRSKEFIHAIGWRLKTRRFFWNLECFVGGR
ncbi:hypothetical protein Tco_0226608, partial [Tanacetum coccineum]